MLTPLVSIITPAYQGQDTIKRAVESVLQQDFPDWEMIIISDDNQNYQSIIQKQGINDPRLKFTSTEKVRSGISNARNKGLAIAKGQYIACLDCDDQFKSNKLSALIPLTEKYGAAISSIEYRDHQSGDLLENWNIIPHGETLYPQDVFLACFQHCSLYLYDRKKINSWYNTELLCAEDYIFLMSFFNEIETIGYHTNPLHIYYRRAGSFSNSDNSAELFIISKQKILQKIRNNQIEIKNSKIRDVVKHDIELSLKVENLYAEKIKQDSNITFQFLMKSYLTQQIK